MDRNQKLKLDKLIQRKITGSWGDIKPIPKKSKKLKIGSLALRGEQRGGE